MSQSETLAGNVAAGRIGPAEAQALQRGFEAWLSARGEIPLERCLQLPTTTKAMARADRDKWLVRAWRLVDEGRPWMTSVALCNELQTFAARIWPAWRDGDAPPPGASELRSALFMAMKSGARVPGTAQQIHNVCAQINSECNLG